MPKISNERYQHYKNNKLYELLGIARHSETLEEMVIYKALYHSAQFGENQIWVRPKAMFFEHVMYNGCIVPRFKRLND